MQGENSDVFTGHNLGCILLPQLYLSRRTSSAVAFALRQKNPVRMEQDFCVETGCRAKFCKLGGGSGPKSVDTGTRAVIFKEDANVKKYFLFPSAATTEDQC